MKVRELVASRWPAIREVAVGHGIERIRWWPPTYGLDRSADFLVDGELGSLRELRADLERELGCQVAIYLADQVPAGVLEGEAPVESSEEKETAPTDLSSSSTTGLSTGCGSVARIPRDRDEA
jgi:hypothetical protein